MKIKIKVKELTEGCMPEINVLGDWIDLRSAVNMSLLAPQAETLKYKEVSDTKVGFRNVNLKTFYIPLGVAMEIPEGYEAILASRSSTPKKFDIFIPTGFGIIDNTFKGDNDEWNFVCTPMKETWISKGDRICQFRIQLSQKATFWQKLKWLFSSGVELVKVDSLGNKDRGGLGSTGTNKIVKIKCS